MDMKKIQDLWNRIPEEQKEEIGGFNEFVKTILEEEEE